MICPIQNMCSRFESWSGVDSLENDKLFEEKKRIKMEKHEKLPQWNYEDWKRFFPSWFNDKLEKHSIWCILKREKHPRTHTFSNDRKWFSIIIHCKAKKKRKFIDHFDNSISFALFRPICKVPINKLPSVIFMNIQLVYALLCDVFGIYRIFIIFFSFIKPLINCDRDNVILWIF